MNFELAEEEKKSGWVEVKEEHVKHVWGHGEGSDCEHAQEKVEVSSSFYAESGNPVCEFCDEELCYEKTMVFLGA